MTGIISAVALSFMVHEPKGIIVLSEREIPIREPAHVPEHFRF